MVMYTVYLCGEFSLQPVRHTLLSGHDGLVHGTQETHYPTVVYPYDAQRMEERGALPPGRSKYFVPSLAPALVEYPPPDKIKGFSTWHRKMSKHESGYVGAFH